MGLSSTINALVKAQRRVPPGRFILETSYSLELMSWRIPEMVREASFMNLGVVAGANFNKRNYTDQNG